MRSSLLILSLLGMCLLGLCGGKKPPSKSTTTAKERAIQQLLRMERTLPRTRCQRQRRCYSRLLDDLRTHHLARLRWPHPSRAFSQKQLTSGSWRWPWSSLKRPQITTLQWQNLRWYKHRRHGWGLQIQPRKTRPFLYLPHSKGAHNQNRLSKLDTRTGQVLWDKALADPAKPKSKAGICTRDLGKYVGSDPSRTVVDARGRVWVAMRDEQGHVAVISPKARCLGAVAVGKGARAIAIDGKGFVWAGSVDKNTLKKIDPNTFKPLRTIKLPNLGPYGAATDSRGHIWIVSIKRTHLYQLNTTGKAKWGPALPLPKIYNVAIDKRRSIMWALRYKKPYGVYRVRLKRLAKTRPLAIKGAKGLREYALKKGYHYDFIAFGKSDCYGIAVDPYTGTAWATCGKDKSLYRIRLAAKQAHPIALGGEGLKGVAVASDGTIWAVSCAEGKVYRYDPRTRKKPTSFFACNTKRPGANQCRTMSPYVYSDFTGAQELRSQGVWVFRVRMPCATQSLRFSWRTRFLYRALRKDSVQLQVRPSGSQGKWRTARSDEILRFAQAHARFDLRLTLTSGHHSRFETLQLTLQQFSIASGCLALKRSCPALARQKCKPPPRPAKPRARPKRTARQKKRIFRYSYGELERRLGPMLGWHKNSTKSPRNCKGNCKHKADVMCRLFGHAKHALWDKKGGTRMRDEGTCIHSLACE